MLALAGLMVQLVLPLMHRGHHQTGHGPGCQSTQFAAHSAGKIAGQRAVAQAGSGDGASADCPICIAVVRGVQGETPRTLAPLLVERLPWFAPAPDAVGGEARGGFERGLGARGPPVNC